MTLPLDASVPDEGAGNIGYLDERMAETGELKTGCERRELGLHSRGAADRHMAHLGRSQCPSPSRNLLLWAARGFPISPSPPSRFWKRIREQILEKRVPRTPVGTIGAASFPCHVPFWQSRKVYPWCCGQVITIFRLYATALRKDRGRSRPSNPKAEPQELLGLARQTVLQQLRDYGDATIPGSLKPPAAP